MAANQYGSTTASAIWLSYRQVAVQLLAAASFWTSGTPSTAAIPALAFASVTLNLDGFPVRRTRCNPFSYWVAAMGALCSAARAFHAMPFTKNCFDTASRTPPEGICPNLHRIMGIRHVVTLGTRGRSKGACSSAFTSAVMVDNTPQDKP